MSSGQFYSALNLVLWAGVAPDGWEACHPRGLMSGWRRLWGKKGHAHQPSDYFARHFRLAPPSSTCAGKLGPLAYRASVSVAERGT